MSKSGENVEVPAADACVVNQASEPMPVAATGHRSVLAYRQMLRLAEFLQQVTDLDEFYATQLVDRATAALGHPVSASNIRTVAKAHGLQFRSRRSAAAVPEAIEERLLAIEEKLDRLDMSVAVSLPARIDACRLVIRDVAGMVVLVNQRVPISQEMREAVAAAANGPAGVATDDSGA